MVKTWTEEAREEGREEGQRKLLLHLLEAKFPSLSAGVRQRIGEWPVDKLPALGEALLKVETLRDLGQVWNVNGRNPET